MTTRAWVSRAVSEGTASRCASSMTRSPSRARRDSSRTPSAYPTCAPSRLCWTRWHWPAASYGLSGWVLYPTREENVAAIAANRDVLRQDIPGAHPRALLNPVCLGQAGGIQPGRASVHPGTPDVVPAVGGGPGRDRGRRPGRPEARDQGALLLRHARQSVAGRHGSGAAGRLPPSHGDHAGQRDHRPGNDPRRWRAAVCLLRILPGGPPSGEHDGAATPSASLGLRPCEHVRRDDLAAGDSRNPHAVS